MTHLWCWYSLTLLPLFPDWSSWLWRPVWPLGAKLYIQHTKLPRILWEWGRVWVNLSAFSPPVFTHDHWFHLRTCDVFTWQQVVITHNAVLLQVCGLCMLGKVTIFSSTSWTLTLKHPVMWWKCGMGRALTPPYWVRLCFTHNPLQLYPHQKTSKWILRWPKW